MLDFYHANTREATPMLNFVHGGGWTSGDKVNRLAPYLKNGISVVSVNYCLIPDADTEKIYPSVKVY